jgi:2,3-bisphosphoglycerate-dependent phosphoglycerate mutase
MERYLVLVRHGQSTYNAENRFTGWHDPALTEAGIAQAHAVAHSLGSLGFGFCRAFSSVLERAKRSAEIILADLGASDVPVTADAALNERNYGQLTGLDKDQSRARWGASDIQRWRRSYQDAPPGGESLRDTAARVLAFYVQEILPTVMRYEPALVVAHGNSLRALVMVLDCLSAEMVLELEIATGEVLVYELNPDTTVFRRTRLNVRCAD